MKPRIGIMLIVLIFLGVFVIYSNLPDQTKSLVSTDEEPQANTSVVLGDMVIGRGLAVELENKRTPANIDIRSTSGLNEELRGIIQGFNVITDELQSLEKTPAEPAQ